MAAATPDRLSDLPDELLIHILSFAPTREAASTTALARRWRRPLWLETCVINFDYRSYITTGGAVPPGRLADDTRRAYKLYSCRGRALRKITHVICNCTMHEKVEEDADAVTEEQENVSEVREECTCIGAAQVLAGVEEIRVERQDCAPLRRSARLADLRLETVYFEDNQYEFCLRCPAATVIVIANIHAFSPDLQFRACDVKIDAPCLRRFYYAHVVTLKGAYYSFEPSVPPGLEQLTAYSIADLHSVMQYNFYDLEVLEIEDLCGWCIGNDDGMANALVNLLRQCPGLCELRLRFSWCKYLEETTDPTVLSAAMSDFPLWRSFVNSGDVDDDEGCLDGLDLIQKLCGGCKLNCLQSMLTRVVVKFEADELTCFQVQLIKFLAKNAMALEEFVVDGGKWYDSCHIDRKIKRWRQRRRCTSSPIPAMTQHPLWPPLLSKFPPLGHAPDVDQISATPCSGEATMSNSWW
ncbi:unnamed protein product [Alopecurus aequalis]